MSGMPPLIGLDGLPAPVARPAYDRAALGHGIVHIGPGAFFRAHVAVYTDEAIAAAGGDWGIAAAGLRSTDTVDALAAQHGLFTVLVREAEETTARVVGAVRAAFAAPRDPERLPALLADPATRIVMLTVTEKAYGLDPATGGLDRRHPDVAADLAQPERPRGVVGHLVEGLARRRAANARPFTPLCCDNLPANGALLKRLVLEFARERDPALAGWIAAHVPFPSTMVDRITPAGTAATLADAALLTGRRDRAAVETEPFSQWVIEDAFAAGRPAWDEAGALFVADVAPYEKMKLRMLNGAHSLIAYLGFLAGHEFVRDAMADPAFAALVRRHMLAAADTLDPVPGIDLADYAGQLAQRFSNPAIAHRTYQIAMDGTQKLPQRLLEPAAILLGRGDRAPTFALAVAAWMRYALGRDRDGRPYALRDPRGEEIAEALRGRAGGGRAAAQALFALPGLFPAAVTQNAAWRGEVERLLDLLIAGDVAAAIDAASRA